MQIEYGSWRIVKKLGAGSFGTVYEIAQEDFGFTNKAALRVIRIPVSNDEVSIIQSQGVGEDDVRDYFRNVVDNVVDRMRIMSQLQGTTNIVNYQEHEIREHNDGIGGDIFVRMELLTPLNTYVSEHKIVRQDVIRLGIDICRALECCKEYHLIYCDIKPSNIFVSDRGIYKLGDLGIACTMTNAMPKMSHKETYNYTAPEVYKSQPFNASVDIYSLGLVMYHLLNYNRAPFMPPYPQEIHFQDSQTAFICRMNGTPLPMPYQEHGKLAEIVLKACSYNPSERYSDPQEMRKDLENLQRQYEQEAYTAGSEGILIIPTVDSVLERSKITISSRNQRVDASDKDNITILLKKSEGQQNQEDKGDNRTASLLNKDASKLMEEEMTEESAEKMNISEELPLSNAPSPKKKQIKKKLGVAVAGFGFVAATVGGGVFLSGHTLVPNVTGMELAEAEQKLENSSLIIRDETEKNSDEFEYGYVISVDNSGQWVAKNSEVSLIVSKGTKFSVPNVVGVTDAIAKKRLLELGLAVDIDTEYSDDYAEGTISKQSLKANTQASQGDQIVISVSRGPKPFDMDNYKKKTLEEAQEAAKSLGLIVKVEKKYSLKTEKGCIMKHFPAAGKSVRKGDTVTFTVSKGPRQIKVPDLSGMTKDKALAALKKVNLNGTTTQVYSSSVASGKVVSQIQKAGSKVDEESTVTFSVSIGPKPVVKKSYSSSSGGSSKRSSGGGWSNSGFDGWSSSGFD